MAVNLPTLSPLNTIAGIKIGTACAAIKQNQQDDIALFELAPHSSTAVVLTRNAFCAAPVQIVRQHVEQTSPQFLLINSGNANAGTGQPGRQDALSCCEAVAQLTGCATSAVLPFSTGVIGQRLPVAKIQAALPKAVAALTPAGWEKGARAIMTTDTQPKGVSTQILLEGQSVNITGIAKGAGMIKPDMATLLVFIATEAAVTQPILQTCLIQAVNQSFHRISIDGDTSTNDACVLIATGQKGPLIETTTQPAFNVLQAAITAVCEQLAQWIVRDGEGATKFITLQVEQGASEQACLQVAYTIAHSLLVKTAFFASDANWGRILAAVGRSGIANLNVQHISIYLNAVCIVQQGEIASSYTEAQGQQVMQNAEICIRVLLGQGRRRAHLWTCDLSHDYVRINADYRT
jgi:glutamate N-acetyltransferase/amino-acid N-acetyltransferase